MLHGILVFANQSPILHHPKHDSILWPLLSLAAFAAFGALLTALLSRVAPTLRRKLRARRSHRRWLHASATTELRARAMMDELCPDGWQAEITLFSSADGLPPEAPNPARTRVQLEWSEGLRETAAIRCVWAPDLNHALEAMVVDRVTEVTLHQIEQQALADGVDWDDV